MRFGRDVDYLHGDSTTSWKSRNFKSDRLPVGGGVSGNTEKKPPKGNPFMGL